MANAFKSCLLAGFGAVALAGCSSGGGTGGGSAASSTTTTASANTSTPATNTSGTQTTASLTVEPCFNQTLFAGESVRQFLARDTIRYDDTQPAGFPNGRRLQDPVIDLTLGYLFTDLTKTPPDGVAKLAVNPPANDKPFLTEFPYVAAAWDQVVPEGTGSGFAFRDNAAADYVNVDAMGMPAVATVLISNNNQPGYNDNMPADYMSGGGKYIPQMSQSLLGLATLLKDDFERLSFTTCAKTVS